MSLKIDQISLNKDITYILLRKRLSMSLYIWQSNHWVAQLSVMDGQGPVISSSRVKENSKASV